VNLRLDDQEATELLRDLTERPDSSVLDDELWNELAIHCDLNGRAGRRFGSFSWLPGAK
jgi:hypothetical protein